MSLITASQLATAMGVRTETVYAWTNKGKIPSVASGKRRLYSLSEVRSALPGSGECRCSKCFEIKPAELFPATKKGSGRSSWCRGCSSKAKREHRRKTAADNGKEFISREESRLARETRKKEGDAKERLRLAMVQEGARLRRVAREAQLKAEGREGRSHTLAEKDRHTARDRERRATDSAYAAKIKAAKIRRYRAKADTQIDHVDYIVVAERDGWTCAICRKTVARKNWSLDHIIPISQGGHHVYGNVVLAHKVCNSRRGVKPYRIHPLTGHPHTARVPSRGVCP